MDEADKYKQRLEAIAEKRRLQEEQDRVRREMEDEKLRLQQLKRKSLRDQWLMEGPLQSPTSQVSQSPHSPLWGSKAQEIEKHIDKLQAEHEHFAEEEEKLKVQLENGQTEAVTVAEANAEDLNGIVPNGGDIAGESATEDKLKMDLSLVADDAATLLTNGGGEGDVSEEGTQSSTNSPVLSSEHTDMKSEDRPDVPVSEDEHAPISNVGICQDEEVEGTLVIRAERVIVTDEGNDVHEDLVALTDQQSERAAMSNPEGGRDVAMMEEIRTGKVTELSTQGDDADATQHTVETDLQDFTDTSTDGPDKASDPTSLQMQPPPGSAEDAALSSLPVYGESTLKPELPLEAAAAEVLPEGSEAVVKAQDPVAAPGHFQDVSLAEPQQHQPEEQEPLLSQTTAPDICSEAEAAVNVTCSPEAQSAPRAGQGEDTQAPKHKTCQCCSVM
ncbi:paralemmin-3 isoform X2 [Nelusetta ayraudi]|uniref:paralemmin-3 isoform X2 n=1 Tax=Nelusetta ayraudi TaxID=303726 RepID=UPI003F728198